MKRYTFENVEFITEYEAAYRQVAELKEEIERLTKRCEEARKLIDVVFTQCPDENSWATNAGEWLGGKP